MAALKPTRRQFLKGAAATAAAASVVSLLPGCTNRPSSDGKPQVLDYEDAVDALASYSEDKASLETKGEWQIEVGNVLHAGGPTWLPAVGIASTTVPSIVARAFSLASGTVVDVVSEPLTKGPNWVIYDSRCSDEVYAWVEVDALTRDWKLIAQEFSDGSLVGSPKTLWEADKDWDPALFVCSGKAVIWQVMPALSGDKTAEHSFCYLWRTGTDSSKAVVESPGRFASEPSVSGDVVTLAPRVNAEEGVYYGITAYSLESDFEKVLDQLVLPTSIKPFRATRIGDVFAFSIEANYDSGGLFGNMGTYIGPSEGPYVMLSREPSAEVVGNGEGLFLIKSRASYFVIDTAKETYAILLSTDRSVDYGEYPASDGQTDTFVTFATVKESGTGLPNAVNIRALSI